MLACGYRLFSSNLVIADTHALAYNIKKIKLFRTTEKKKS